MSAVEGLLAFIALFAGAWVGRLLWLIGHHIERYFAEGEERRALEQKWEPHR